MIQSPDKPHYRMVAHRILEGRVVFFLGAGVNLCGRPDSVRFMRGQYLPSGAELAAYLARRLDYPYEDTSNLLRVSQFVDVKLGVGALYEELHQVFDADYAPTPVHQLLASLPAMIRARAPDQPPFFPLIVTTNYDDALERAFAEKGEAYDLVVYIADGPERGRFLHTKPDGESQIIAVPNEYRELQFSQHPVIAKIHGAVVRGSQDDDSYVVTENHYIDYLSHTDIAMLIPITVAERMRRSNLLFLGYSLKDWNLRVILNRLQLGANVRWNNWAVQTQPDDLEERSWIRRNVELLDERLEIYIDGLRAAMLEVSTMAGSVP
jgi:SIR2-like domain